MSDQDAVTIANLTKRLNAAWESVDQFTSGLSEAQLTIPTDDAGWTVKDHLMHLAVWQRGITALLRGQARWDAMGISRELFLSEGYDEKNAVIQQQHKDQSVVEVLAALRGAQDDLLAVVAGMQDADLLLPYKHYAPDTDRDAPVIYWIDGNSFGHYAQHLPWMQAIVAPVSTARLTAQMQAGWAMLESFIGGTSVAQMTIPTDDAGWTVKDHLMHLAVWQNGVTAVLRRQTRWEAMGISRDLLQSGDFDEINAVIQQAHKEKPLDEVKVALRAAHEDMLAMIAGMTDADLLLPYRHFAPDSERDAPIINWIVADSFEHYEEHLPWMQAIAAQGA